MTASDMRRESGEKKNRNLMIRPSLDSRVSLALFFRCSCIACIVGQKVVGVEVPSDSPTHQSVLSVADLPHDLRSPSLSSTHSVWHLVSSFSAAHDQQSCSGLTRRYLMEPSVMSVSQPLCSRHTHIR